MSQTSPKIAKRQRTLGYLIAGLAGVYVLSLLVAQLTGAVGLNYGDPARQVIDIVMSVVHYGVLALLALRIPQPALRVLALTVFAIFFVDSVLSQLDVFSLLLPWYSAPPPHEYFQF